MQANPMLTCGPKRLLLTQSLLADWLYQFQARDADAAQKTFLRSLCRERSEPTQRMRDGIDFEDRVTAYCERGAWDAAHKWARGVQQVGEVVKGSQFQVALSRPLCVAGIPFLLYGRLDALRAGTIYDIKLSKAYQVGKYVSSPQHPMYVALCPEADRFVYVISDGVHLYQETYWRADVRPIEPMVRDFVDDLRRNALWALYCAHWTARD